jgi:hypothetical protein
MWLQRLLLNHITCRSCFSIYTCITVCTFRMNKAEGLCHLIYRPQSGSGECGAYPTTRPVYRATSTPCRFHVKNTNCTVCQRVGTALLYNTDKLSEFKFCIISCLIFPQETLVEKHCLCLSVCPYSVSHCICGMLMLVVSTLIVYIQQLAKDRLEVI